MTIQHLTPVEILNVWVPGKPVAQARATPVIQSGGRKVKMTTPPKVRAWRKYLAEVISVNCARTYEGPFQVITQFAMPRPKRLMGAGATRMPIPYTNTPDIDNLEKAVYDALSKARIWHDDREVVSVTSSKWYAHLDGEPGVWIKVNRLIEPQ